MDLDALIAGAGRIALEWQEWKRFLEHGAAIGNDAVHVLAGVVLQLAFALLLRRPLPSLAPWLAVLALALLNEASDLWIEAWPDPAMQYGEGAKDVVLTMALPTLLLVTTRYLPKLYERAPERVTELPPETAPDSTSRPL